MIERYFKLTENQTSVRQELLGGLTTFMTMAYIIVVNPQILAQAGMPAEGVLFATCISAAVATLVMGLYANYPIALAPGMSLNAYFTYSVCLGMHIRWQTALGVVFISGVLFVLLTVTQVREQIVNGIPDCLKHSTAAGIGMFIAFVGMRNAKLVVANPSTFVSIGNFSDHEVQVACFGLALTLVLMARRIHSAIVLGILGTTLLGIFRGWRNGPHRLSPFLILRQHYSGSICPVRFTWVCSKSFSFFCLWICSTTWARSWVSANKADSSRMARFRALGARCSRMRWEQCSARFPARPR